MKDEKIKKNKKVEQELAELRGLLQRTQADFINHRRRVEEDKTSFIKLATSDLISQILPILDNLALAAKHVPKNIKDDNWVIGIRAIERQLEQVLQANGLEKINSVGEQFDPNFYEAIHEVSDKKHKDNEIVKEESAGYKMHGKLIRSAKVIVNKIIK